MVGLTKSNGEGGGHAGCDRRISLAIGDGLEHAGVAVAADIHVAEVEVDPVGGPDLPVGEGATVPGGRECVAGHAAPAGDAVHGDAVGGEDSTGAAPVVVALGAVEAGGERCLVVAVGHGLAGWDGGAGSGRTDVEAFIAHDASILAVEALAVGTVCDVFAAAGHGQVGVHAGHAAPAFAVHRTVLDFVEVAVLVVVPGEADGVVAHFTTSGSIGGAHAGVFLAIAVNSLD